jgi:hypothetical protein
MMAFEESTYNSNIQFNGSCDPYRIAIPRNIMIPIGTTIHKVCSCSAGNTNDESGAEEEGDYDALPEGEVESEDYWDRDEDNAKIIHDVHDALDQEMDLLVEAVLWNKRQGPVC